MSKSSGKYLLTFVLLFIVPVILRAQQYPAPGLTVWGTAEGLAQNTINCIYEDHEGFLWIGTHGGLQRFNGYGFISFHEHDSLLRPELMRAVRSVLRHGDDVYFSGDGTLFVLNLRTNKIKKLCEEENIGWAFILHYMEGNRLYLSSTLNGVISYFDLTTGKLVTWFDKLPFILAFDCRYRDGFFYIIQKNSLHKVSAQSGDSKLVFSSHSKLNHFDFNGQNHLIVQTVDSLFIMDLEGSDKRAVMKNDLANVFALHNGFAGLVDENEFVLFDSSGAECYRVRTPYELQAANIGVKLDIIVNDQSGNLWFSKDGVGLFRVDQSTLKFNQAPAPAFTKKFIKVIFQEEQQTWVYALDRTLSIIENASVRTMTLPQEVGHIMEMQKLDEDNVLMNADNGLFTFHQPTSEWNKIYSHDPELGIISCYVQNRDKILFSLGVKF